MESLTPKPGIREHYRPIAEVAPTDEKSMISVAKSFASQNMFCIDASHKTTVLRHLHTRFTAHFS